ncbi:MAG: hypothetical protein ACLQE9_13160, partial [Roseiarcus sp.]
KKLPPHSFGEWVFSRTINVSTETRLIGGVDCRQVLANVAKDGYHHWPELESDSSARGNGSSPVVLKARSAPPM